MNENGKKKREWVKTAAIVFLAVMLALTFFSNTIMNYSLPEVATQYVMSDSITARIRGTGKVESGDPYEVKVTQSRKVSSVAVRVGDKVQKGDVLMYLEDTESEELKDAIAKLEAAKNTLQSARESYNNELLTGGYTAEEIQAANGNTSAASYRKQLTEAQNAVKPLEEKRDQLDQEIRDIAAQIELENALKTAAQGRANTASASMGSVSQGDLQAAADDANKEYEEAKKAYEDSVSGNDGNEEEKKAAMNTAKAKADDANTKLNNYKNAFATYNEAMSEIATRNQTVSNLNTMSATKTVDRYNAQKDVDAAKAKLDALTKMLGNKVRLDGFLDAISAAQKAVDEAQEAVDKEAAKGTNATITADISGTVTSINVTAGNTTSAAVPVAVLQPEGQGYTLSFSVTNEQARRLNVGDRADLVNAWRYDDVNVVLASIKPDTSDPGQRKMLTFDVTGNVVAGQTFNVVVGQQSANFDYVVPNSAIREDSNGKFILIVESKPTPLSTRYRAVRVDVEVLASDDSRSAISGGTLYGYAFVITTSTQPVEPGQQVRLADN